MDFDCVWPAFLTTLLGNFSDMPDRCIALPEASDRRYAGPPHIHVHIATNGGDKNGLAGPSLYLPATSLTN